MIVQAQVEVTLAHETACAAKERIQEMIGEAQREITPAAQTMLTGV